MKDRHIPPHHLMIVSLLCFVVWAVLLWWVLA